VDNTTNTVANKGVSFILLIAGATGCTKQGLRQTLFVEIERINLTSTPPSPKWREVADDVNLLGDNIDTAKKNRGTLINVSKEFSLEVSTKKIKHVLLSCQQNEGINFD
jgi:hypothetical protein